MALPRGYERAGEKILMPRAGSWPTKADCCAMESKRTFMIPLKIAILLILFLAASATTAQYFNNTEHGIKVVKDGALTKRCGNTASKTRSFPPEVRFGTLISGDSVFLSIYSEKWFANFFGNRNDGFAIDVVSKDQYQCDNVSRLAKSPVHKGWLLEPKFKDDIYRTARVNRHGIVTVFGGLVPKELDRKNVEANYILLEDRYACSYIAVVNVSSAAWGLLPMGLYYDTLNVDGNDRYQELEKTLKFKIPFGKNVSEYNKEDIRPLYDSLKLTDYEITSISIKAFTSVEGSLRRNTELQYQRAQSIVDGLQSYQPESISSEITTNENWVEFIEDIQSTPFKYLDRLSKEEVKDALKDPGLAIRIEPILARHRKGIIELALEKRMSYSKSTPAELIKYFDQSVSKHDVNEALYLQEIIFRKVIHGEVPPAFLHQLQVPEAPEFGSLLLNQSAFHYEHGGADLDASITAFTHLQKILKDNQKVEYNICALKLRHWVKTRSASGGNGLKQRIDALTKSNLHPSLVLRLKVNFQIINAEYQYWKGNYKEREPALRFVRDVFLKINASDEDLLSVGNYLATNSRYAWAEAALRPRIKSIDASEDLLFFYATLTMYERKNTSSGGYRTFLLNLVNSNRTRFCHLFDPVSQGGVSMQMLEDPFLKKTWCENCMCIDCK
jgi:hypothetical protein